jgi:hypothetical protein
MNKAPYFIDSEQYLATFNTLSGDAPAGAANPALAGHFRVLAAEYFSYRCATV